MKLLLLFVAALATAVASMCWFEPSVLKVCPAPSGALYAIEYQEKFLGKLSELKFSCLGFNRGICDAYTCVELTAIDAEGKHAIGYVWRNVFNQPKAVFCSPDGGKAGTFYGECPVGTPAPTVYKCPWCDPDFGAVADKRGGRRIDR